jgi:hypothetical protein
VTALALHTLLACTGAPSRNPDGKDTEDLGPGVTLDRRSAETNDNGRLRVEVDVPQGATSLQITGQSAQYVGFEELIAPDGETVLYWEDWYNSRYSLTYAIYGFDRVTALSWPPRDVDRPLEPGTWTAWISVTDRNFIYQPGEAVDLTIATKRDDDFTEGKVGVQIVYADGVKRDEAVVAAVEQAVERWRAVWAGIGIELDEYYTTSDLDAQLGFTYVGDAEVEDLAQEKGEGHLQLIVGESVGNEEYTLGVSAGIPGTIDATPNTFVVLSWLAHAGPNASFDDEEIRLMGETMAHETGHYTGLFHPVETGYEYWDALDDTPDCDSFRSCEDELGKNLMFPYSLCDFEGCVAQGQLSDQQSAVVQQFVGSL